MKFYLLLIALAINYCCYSQADIDSLKKYSYSIVGLFKKGSVEGSCFFIKTNKGLYLITAKHCLTKCYGVTEPPDTMYINIDSFNYLTLPTKKLKSSVKCDNDLMVCSIDTSIHKYINYLRLEDLLELNKGTIQLALIGYPSNSYSVDYVSMTKDTRNPICQSLVLNDKSFKIDYDTSHYYYKSSKSAVRIQFYNFHFIYKDLEGYSGGPVYIQNSNNKWFLIGCSSQWGLGVNSMSMYIEPSPLIISNILNRESSFGRRKRFSDINCVYHHQRDN